MYIKLDNNRDLVITMPAPIIRGENIAKTITCLLPKKVGDIDLSEAAIYLSYIRADDTADIALLAIDTEEYNEQYFSYTFPVTQLMSRYPGVIRMWLQIYAGSGDNPMIAKSGECILCVKDSKNMDEYISERDIDAVCRMKEEIDSQLDGIV